MKKKIVLVVPSLNIGGMERVVSELLNYFCSENIYDVHLILYGKSRDILYPVPVSVQIHKPNFKFDNNRRIHCTLKTLLFLRFQIKKINPDSILSLGELWNNLVLLATFNLKYPIYISDRCQPNKSLGKFHNFLRRKLYPKATGIICQTETARKIYEKLFSHSNIVVIGNPIRFISAFPSCEKENIILSVGRLIKTKNHSDLIHIFTEIDPPNWKLVIVGDDSLKQKNRSQLEALIVELGMGSKIELVGQRLDVDYYYKKAKIFAFTSSSEGFPNVIGEAMSAGLPVISYDCIAGPSELIDHNETGYLVKLYDKDTFKKLLQKLILDDDLRLTMGLNAKEKINQFSQIKIGKKFENLLLNAGTTN